MLREDLGLAPANIEDNSYSRLIVFAIIGLLNKIITTFQLNAMIIIGILALVIGILPYSITARKEEKELEKTIDELTN